MYGFQRSGVYGEDGMNLTIVAATGRIGERLHEQALAAGHEVTVVVRNPRRLALPARRVVTADLLSADPAELEPAVRDADAVLSALGPRSLAEAGVTAPGTRAVVAAMSASSVRRIVVVSAGIVGTVPAPNRPHPPRHDPGDGPLVRYVLAPVVKRALRRNYVDLAEMEDILRVSGLEWTVVRPPRLTDRPLTGAYRTAVGQNVRGGITVSRSDVAHLMLAVLERPETIQQVLSIAR
jgi:putative NADH-flavin reductase